ncbi:MAG: hypothetical protein CMH49_02040 [Myxococcales bacterium]|nr:hypothetical protein [Myxococcales bacterium]
MVTSIQFSQATSAIQSEFRSHTQTIQRSLERLSTGKKINHARDNVAASAINTRLESQLRGISAAVRNSQDAFSLAQTGEATIGEMQNQLYRLRELTLQSQNDTISQRDLETIEKEVFDIVQALEGVVSGARFNQKSLFDGSFKGQQLQLGANVEDSLFVSLQDLRTSFLGRRTLVKSSSGVDTSSRLLDGDIFLLNGVSVRESQASDDQVSVIDGANSAIAKAAAINAVARQTGVTAYVTETRTDVQDTLNTYLGAQTFGATGAVQEVTLTGSTYIEVNHVKIGGFTVQDNDHHKDLVNAINDVTEETGVYAELNSRQELVLVASDGRNIALDYYGDRNGRDLETLIGLKSGNDHTEGSAHNGYAYGGGLRLESLYTIEADFGVEVNTVVGDLVGDYQHSNQSLFAANESSALSQLSLGSRSDRDQALETIDTAIEQITSQRSFLGGVQSRLESNVNSLHQRYEAVSATISRVVDVDFAEEASQLTLHQIKLNALASVMQRSPELNEQIVSLLLTDR